MEHNVKNTNLTPMSSYRRMAVLLKSTGVYPMDGASLIDAEMSAYGAQLDRLLSETEKLAASIFFDNPENPYGSEFERLFGLPVTAASLEGIDLNLRRQKIAAMKQRLSIGNQSFSRTGIQTALASFGITATFQETAELLTVTITDNKDYLATSEEVDQLIAALTPCGTTLQIVRPE